MKFNPLSLVKQIASGGDAEQIIAEVLVSQNIKSCIVELGADGKAILQKSTKSFIDDYKAKIAMIEKLEESLRLVLSDNHNLRLKYEPKKSLSDGNEQ